MRPGSIYCLSVAWYGILAYRNREDKMCLATESWPFSCWSFWVKAALCSDQTKGGGYTGVEQMEVISDD